MPRYSSDPVRDQQLAKIISTELGMILSNAGDDRLQLVEIARVEPKPGGRHFLVVYGPPPGPPGETPGISGADHVHELLVRAHGHIRSELALSLNLKFAPELSYVADPMLWKEWNI